MEGTVKPKEKTKAKQRYLKRKKERRKLNKKAPKVVEHVESESDALDTGSEPVPVTNSEKRPRKRQKVEDPLKVDTRDVEEPAITTAERNSPTPEANLPQFSLPILPDAPSKSELALQGLDQALVDAEFVDPAMTVQFSAEDEDDATMLSAKTRKRLYDLGISELFAVQTKLLPFLLPQDPLLRALYLPYQPPRDVCVSAPTGSGKTLAYVLPIVEVLSSRIVTRLRALVVLPTRDLVIQVRETFEAVSKGRGLKVGTVTGQHSFSHEQAQIVADQDSCLEGGSSKVDILICTPGRLIDHINETPNFSLQHLRFLVIDEADRLLAQSFQDWLVQVLAATRPQQAAADGHGPGPSPNGLPFHDALAPAFLPGARLSGTLYVSEKKQTSCQKLLFSATLTRDPDKIAALQLRNPKYFIVQGSSNNVNSGILDVAMEQFSIPTTLTERMIVCESMQKPLIFFHLVYKHDVTNALVFTKSTESTTRLVTLFDCFKQALESTLAQPSVVAYAYSSDLPVSERRSILEKFKEREIQILVCSDLISRGIDISHVSHVVNYDVPVDMRKYVHRVGRTARAGRTGDAWSLIEEQEARYFKSMLHEAGHLDRVKRIRIGDKALLPWTSPYETALKQFKEASTK